MKIKQIILALSILMISFSCSQRLTKPDGWYEKDINKYFRTEYVEQVYERYDGKITVTEKSDLTYIDFDFLNVNVCLTIENDEYKNIFVTNLFSPQMLGANNNDSISICCVEELTYVRTNATQRRFVYWVFYSNFFNPLEFYLELTNMKVNKKTDLLTFIQEAKVTHISKGRVII